MDRGIYAILLGLMVVVPYVLACSKFHLGARAKDTGHNYDTDERKVFYSNIVVYGEVMGKLDKADKKNFLYKDVDGVDTVEFKILCVYKGGSDLARTIYISGIGNENEEIPGCPSAPLKQSDEVVMFLTQTKHPKVFDIEFGPNSGEADLILDDLSMICGLKNDTKGDELCTYFPPLSKAEGCVSWDPIYVTPKPDENPEPEEESPEPEEEEDKEEPEPKEEPSNKDDTVVDIDTEGKGKNNQSDQGYETKTEKGKNTAPAAGSTGDNGSGSTIITASLLVTLATMFLTIVF